MSRLDPMTPRNWGMHLSLSSDEEMKRAERLVEKDPGTYEISRLLPGIHDCVLPLPQLYLVVGHPEVDLIVKWVQSGEGMEPS